MKRLLPFLILPLAMLAASCGSSKNVAATAEGDPVDVGYGSVDKEKLSYSVSSMQMAEEESVVYTNMYDYLRGKVPGVYVGPENTMSSIVIRGVGTINGSTTPLVLLDGVEISDLDAVTPYDVHSVSVLKDSSAAIYGFKGANGVILITTKGAYQQKQAAEEAKKQEKEAQRAARAAARAAKRK